MAQAGDNARIRWWAWETFKSYFEGVLWIRFSDFCRCIVSPQLDWRKDAFPHSA